MKRILFVNVFIAAAFEVALAVCPGWCGCWRTVLHPFPGGSLEEGHSVKVSAGCPDESCLSDRCISGGLEEILAFLLAFEVLCHCHGFIKGFVESFHHCADIIGFKDVAVGFHVLDEGSWVHTEHKFIFFVVQVCNEFSRHCFLHVLQASLDEVVSAAEEFKLLLTEGFLSGDLAV